MEGIKRLSLLASNKQFTAHHISVCTPRWAHEFKIRSTNLRGTLSSVHQVDHNFLVKQSGFPPRLGQFPPAAHSPGQARRRRSIVVAAIAWWVPPARPGEISDTRWEGEIHWGCSFRERRGQGSSRIFICGVCERHADTMDVVLSPDLPAGLGD